VDGLVEDYDVDKGLMGKVMCLEVVPGNFVIVA
jgi:hypothetical protein